MELKPAKYEQAKQEALGFNRTFMELKLLVMLFCVLQQQCFNRTFMELKQCRGISRLDDFVVLIGPSWN